MNLSANLKGFLQILMIIVVLILGIAANFLLTNTGSSVEQRASGSEAVLVEVTQPETITTAIRVKENGIVQSRNKVGLTPQVSGQVVEVSPNLASGGVFEADEILFRLDPADYQASVDQARADVSSAKAKLRVEMAEAETARREWQLVHPGEPIPDLVAREPQIEQARASLESAQARLTTAELSLKRVAFSLPFSGRIVETTVELGQRLSASQSYGKAYAIGNIEVPVPLDAEIIQQLNPVVGRKAVVRTTGRRDSRAFPATVSRVDAELDEGSRLGRVILVFDEPADIIPGTFVSVEITGPQVENALVIPELAMPEARTCWVVREGRLRQQKLEFLGLTETGDLTVAPFDTGDGIVVSPLSKPVDSMPARIANREGVR